MNIYFLIELTRHRWLRRRYIEYMLRNNGLNKRRAVSIVNRWVY